MNRVDKHLEVHNILLDGLKKLNDIKKSQHKYYYFDKDGLRKYIQLYNDVIDHMNDFICEVLE